MSVTIYGIKNCDTMKKAFVWLEANGVAYVFHDYRADGVSRGDLIRWCDAAGWQKVLNKASTTFRALPEDARSGLDQDKAVDLMIAQPTMIKRPVLDTGDAVEIGFRADRYADLLTR